MMDAKVPTMKEKPGMNEEQYRIITSASMDGFVMTDATGKLLDVNEAYSRMIGYSREELLKMSVSDIEALETPDEIHQKIQKTKGNSRLFETRHRCKDGLLIDVEVSMTIAPLSDRIFVFIRNISDRKRAEEALRDSEMKYAAVVQQAKDGVIIIQDNILKFVNKGITKILGYTRDELENTPYLNYVAPESQTMITQRINARLEGKNVPQIYEAKLLHKDGTIVDAELSASVIQYQGKAADVGIIRDITARKRLEEDRGKFESQMREVQKLESLGVLAGGIAHDFNNLLMTILGNADLALLSLPPASPIRQNIEAIINASQRAADLCRQMLAYSGRGRFVLGQYSLSEIIQEMSHMLQVSVSKKISLRYRLAKDLPAVKADALQLRQMIINLITNASEAIGNETGVIEISNGVMECDEDYLAGSYLNDTLPAGRYVYLEVSDSGSGMDTETRQKIFDPFFTTKFIGRGLGLSAVLGIVRGHKGAVKVYSEPGKGTTIKVLLPVVEKTSFELKKIEDENEVSTGRKTILLVDDDSSILDVASKMLERLGFTVTAASDGRKGLDAFQERHGKIDCVLLDLTMPHPDGEEVFREMRRIRNDVRIIISSGYNEQEVTQRFVGKDLTGFVQKPYTLARLRETMRNVFNQPE